MDRALTRGGWEYNDTVTIVHGQAYYDAKVFLRHIVSLPFFFLSFFHTLLYNGYIIGPQL